MYDRLDSVHGELNMADYRIEACPDPESGLYYVQVFCPSTATVAVVRTKPVYSSLEEAQRRVGETITAAISKNPEPEWKAIVFDNT
jgi:hypothetical protein